MSLHDPKHSPDGSHDPSKSGPGADGELVSGTSRADGVASLAARKRMRQVIRAMRSLESRSAPAQLEGLVVASMNVGHRQDRAVRALSSLSSVAAPEQLEAAVAARVLGSDPRPRTGGAPTEFASEFASELATELDGLVADRVVDPAGSLVEGLTQRLQPIGAPMALDQQINAQLDQGHGADVPGESPRQLSGGAPGRARTFAGVFTGAGFALAACALLAITTIGLRQDRAALQSPASDVTTAEAAVAEGPTRTSSGVLFTVVRVTSDNLESTDREVLGVLGLSVDGGNS